MLNSKIKYELRLLVNLSLEGVASDHDYRRLNEILTLSQDCFNYYLKLIEIHQVLRSSDWRIESSNLNSFQRVFEELALYEKTAPAIDIPKEKPQPELPEKIVLEKSSRTLSKSNIFSLIVSVAAMLFVVLFLRYAPDKNVSSVEVATLVDQINAQWTYPAETNLEVGDRLWTGQGIWRLDKGIVKIQYDDGVDVLVEGPTVFEIDRSGIYLEHGRLFSRVPETGLGFTVTTQNAQFIDHGTEFGVQVDTNGSSELHVIRGRVQLFAGVKGKPKVAQMVTENEAVRYSANSSQLKDIPIQNETFVRSICSGTQTVWRGQEYLDLADIVGGGDGYGSGTLNTGVNPMTGEYEQDTVHGDQVGNGRIINAPDLAYVDSLFIPDQYPEGLAISSTGILYHDFNDTNGKLWGNVSNGDLIYLSHQDEDESTEESELIQHALLRGQSYGTNDRSGLMMHANMGITYDLDAIRQSHPVAEIKRFISQAGVPDQAWKGKVNVYIIIDGQRRFHAENLTYEDEILQIGIPIKNHERFLTLAVTDCDQDNQLDWFQFGKPLLVLR